VVKITEEGYNYKRVENIFVGPCPFAQVTRSASLICSFGFVSISLLLGPHRVQRPLVPTIAGAVVSIPAAEEKFGVREDDPIPVLEDVEDTAAFFAQTDGQDLEVLIKQRVVIDVGVVTARPKTVVSG